MTITVVSKHLPQIWRYIGLPVGDSLLELLHIIEAARYHTKRFEALTHGEGEAPDNFETGIDIGSDDINHYWRFMATWIEMESFFFRGKQFLDLTWRCLGERICFGAEEIPTLSGAIMKLKDKVKDEKVRKIIHERPYFIALQTAWVNWGSELAGIRNYLEHHAMFGGLALAHGATVTDHGQITYLYLPDESPKWMENPPKREFTYNNQRSVLDYFKNRMEDIDALLVELMKVDEVLLCMN
jgi:hypothetical protein